MKQIEWNKSIVRALEHMTTELMLLGVASVIILAFQERINKICGKAAQVPLEKHLPWLCMPLACTLPSQCKSVGHDVWSP